MYFLEKRDIQVNHVEEREAEWVFRTLRGTGHRRDDECRYVKVVSKARPKRSS